MDEALRPDLSRILPRPWLRRPPPGPPLAEALVTPAAGDDADFVVAVTRRRQAEPDDAGFALAQAQAVATRLAGWFRAADHPAPAALHRSEPTRVQRALGPPPPPARS